MKERRQTHAEWRRMAEGGQAETVSMYLRVPRTANEALSEIASLLDMKLSAVANAIFRFVMRPDWFVDWPQHVETLRGVVKRDRADLACMADFTVEDWQRRAATFKRLAEMGLIERLDFSTSLSDSGRVICTFNVTDAGRVIAKLFDETGMTKTVRADELLKPDDEAPMAS
jgi:hypothetical protein